MEQGSAREASRTNTGSRPTRSRKSATAASHNQQLATSNQQPSTSNPQFQGVITHAQASTPRRQDPREARGGREQNQERDRPPGHRQGKAQARHRAGRR